MLFAYSRHNPDVGYCQGMNYLAALLLIGVNMKQDLAFTIMVKLMESPEYDLQALYSPTLKKLFEFADNVYVWLLQELPQLEDHLMQAGIPLTTMLASPFMALFANLTDVETALHVLDRMVLLGAETLVQIVKQVFRGANCKIMEISDCDLLHPYLVKQIYIEAVQEGTFFPKID